MSDDGYMYPDRDDRVWEVRIWQDSIGWTWEGRDQHNGQLFNSGSFPRHHRSRAKAEQEFEQAVRAERTMRANLAAAERARKQAPWILKGDKE